TSLGDLLPSLKRGACAQPQRIADPSSDSIGRLNGQYPGHCLSCGIREGRHVVYLLHAQLVFVTKRRGLRASRKSFDQSATISRWLLKEFNGEPDPCNPASQLPAEGPIVRAGEQLERRFFSADQARIPGHF